MLSEVIDDPSLLAIAEFCDGEVTRRQDGWRELIYMQGLKFFANGAEEKMDAVLCLNHDNATYPTKLYLERPVGVGLNWNETAYLLSRQWHTFSWSNVSPNQPAMHILAAHLAALNQRSGA